MRRRGEEAYKQRVEDGHAKTFAIVLSGCAVEKKICQFGRKLAAVHPALHRGAQRPPGVLPRLQGRSYTRPTQPEERADSSQLPVEDVHLRRAQWHQGLPVMIQDHVLHLASLLLLAEMFD